MLQSLRQLLRPLVTQVANLVARAVVQLADDGPKLQLLQLGVGAGETRDGCERFQEYGFTSVPLAGAEAVVIFPNGRRDHGLVVAVDDRRYRLAGLAPGDVAVYRAGALHLVLRSTRATLTAAEVRLGSDAASDYVARASLVDARLSALKSAISGAAVVAGDGGAAFKTNLLAALSSWPASVAASKVKAE
jgi:phage baseplate assembly protein V